ncbi:MAG: hypothetical protein ACR2FV_15465 [Ornithinimicrobium sp.]|uniref:hypothetical protein n=1 Tax=Ornithinimicrobium sp. TaxID=1977084 RepID=UPI003D9B399F
MVVNVSVMNEEGVAGTGTPGLCDVTVGFDASEWTSEQLIAFVTRSPQQVALDQVSQGLNGLGLPSGVADAVLAVVTSAAAHQGGAAGESATARVAPATAIDDDAVLAAAHGARVLQGFAEGALIDTARTLADRAGAELLARRGLCDPAEMCPTKREKWRGRTKALVAQELSVLTGHGIQAAHVIVGFALAPPASVAASTAALQAGKTNWRAVSAFWQRCRTFEATAAGEVDQAVFGPLLAHPTPEDRAETPGNTDPENPDTEADDTESPDDHGQARGQDQRCESWPEFSRRLEREAVRAESADAADARAKRRAAMSRRDVQARIGDQGTGEVILTGSTTSVAGAVERIETIARAAKAAGDQRSLGQIRSDTGFALLVHGILPLPGTPTGACAGGCAGAAGSPTGPRPGRRSPRLAPRAPRVPAPQHRGPAAGREGRRATPRDRCSPRSR